MVAAHDGHLCNFWQHSNTTCGSQHRGQGPCGPFNGVDALRPDSTYDGDCCPVTGQAADLHLWVRGLIFEFGRDGLADAFWRVSSGLDPASVWHKDKA